MHVAFSHSRRIVRRSPLFVATLAGLAVLGIAPQLMAAGVPNGTWTVKPDPPTRKIDWPDSMNWSIPLPSREGEVLFPTTESEFVLTGLGHNDCENAQLWNMTTGKSEGSRLIGTPAKAYKRALSPDGKHLGISVLGQDNGIGIEVWSLETGKRLSAFPADDKGMHITILDFAGSGELMTFTFGQVAGKFVHHLRVWDVTTGKSTRQIDFDKNVSGDRKYDVSPGRRWLVSMDYPDTVIYDLQTGQLKAKIHPAEKTDAGDHVHGEGVRFSADGTELGLFSHGTKGDVVEVIDMATGESKHKHEIAPSARAALRHPASYKGPPIEFVPAPAGFLYYGSGFVERDSGLMVWAFKHGDTDFNHAKQLLTPAGFIAVMGDSSSRRLQPIPFPIEKLTKSVEAYRNDAPAVVKPGVKVKVAVKVGAVRFGKPEDARKSIEEVLEERLATDGLEVADDGTTLMTVDYKEAAGKTLQEVQGGSPLRGGVPTGRTVQSTAYSVSIKWTSKDAKTKIYEETFNLDPTYLSVRGTDKITDEDARKQVFEMLKAQLAGLPIPYFVPEDKSLAVLPMSTASPVSGGKLSQGDSIRKKIEARKNLTKKPK